MKKVSKMKSAAKKVYYKIVTDNLKQQAKKYGYDKNEDIFRDLNIDLSNQYTSHIEMNEYAFYKMSNQQSFECGLAVDAVKKYILTRGGYFIKTLHSRYRGLCRNPC